MAGGKFSSMNRVRPGAYINFETNAAEVYTIGDRGIATFAQELAWGENGKLIEISADELLNGGSLAKIGLTIEDANALLYKLALQNCKTLKVYKLNSGGTKASATLLSGALVATAKCAGTFGNKIAIIVKASGDLFNVETYANGYYVDSQKVSSASELVANDFVTFSGTGSLSTVASTLLTGGTDGSVSSMATAYDSYFALLRVTKWHTMAVPTDDATVNTKVATFITEMREEEGRYVQAVVANSTTADYEGIINNVNGVVLEDNTNVTAVQFTAWVAGVTAGADIIGSNTGKIVDNAISIVNSLSNNEIIAALENGKFVLSFTQEGKVKVEKDINSLHTFTADKGYIFSKNRVIRELDEIGSEIESIWETTYLGKVSNNADGRTMFKASIVTYLTELQNKGAITDFDSSKVTVIAGNDIDSVIASLAIKPVDSMEFLYLTVNVEQ